MRRPQRRYQLPPLISHPLDDLWSVVVPIARTNLVTNPSLETNTTGWTAFGGASIARSTAQQYHGAYSLQVTPSAATNDGAYFQPVSLTSGVTYAISAKVRGAAGVSYFIDVATTGGVRLASYVFVGTGRWQWVWLFYTETSTTTRRIEILKNSNINTGVFYVDGLQVEACAPGEVFATTYIDGDQQGLVPNQYPPAYLWTGVPHASTSSRSGLTRAGGRVVKFKTFGWLLTAIIGLGPATPQNQTMDYAALDGGQDLGTRKPTRQFTLAGQFAANTYERLRENRGALSALLDRDLIGEDQRLKLRYQAYSGCNPVGEEAEVICKYQGGLEGNTDGHFGSSAPLTFTQYLPVVLSPGEAGAALTVNQTVTDADQIIQRSPGGAWSAMGTGVTGAGIGTTAVYAIAPSNSDYVYAGGDYSAMGGVANTRAISRWSRSGGAWSAMGTGAAATGIPIVYDLAIAPNGDVWAVGEFDGMGGVANTARAARWDGSVWNGPTYPLTNAIYGVAIGPTGIVYTVDVAGKIYSYDGTTWTLIGATAGPSTTLRDVTIGPDGNLYIAGKFTSVSGVASVNVAHYTLSSASPAWEACGTPIGSGNATGLVFDNAGLLYVAFDATPYFERWNGSQWVSIGSLGGGFAWATGRYALSQIAVYGRFTTSNNIALPDSLGFWNGSVVLPADVNLPGTPGTNIVYVVRSANDGTTYVGFDASGAATAAGLTTVNNIGTARAYPTLTMNYPSVGTTRVYQIVNITTGRAIYLNLTMNQGETVIMRFDPDDLSFVSDFSGSVASSILPGSNEADFFLQPGDNVISFFTEGGTLTATLQWRPAYLSLDDR